MATPIFHANRTRFLQTIPQVTSVSETWSNRPLFEPNTAFLDILSDQLQNNPSDPTALPQTAANWLNRRFGANYLASTDIAVCSGVKSAVQTLLAGLVTEGTEVLLPEPCADYWVPLITLYGGVPVLISLEGPEFKFNWDKIHKSITQNTQLLIIPSPNSFTGKALEEEDYLKIEKIIRNSHIKIVTEESGNLLHFEKLNRSSICSYPTLRERCFVCYDLTHAMGSEQWPMAFIAAPKALFQLAYPSFHFLHQAPAHEVQQAYSIFWNSSDLVEQRTHFIQQHVEQNLKTLGMLHLNILPVKFGFHALCTFDTNTAESDLAFAHTLLSEQGIALWPLSLNYQNRAKCSFLRINLSVPSNEMQNIAHQMVRTTPQSPLE